MAARTPIPAPRAAFIILNHSQNPDLVLQKHINVASQQDGGNLS